MVGEQSVHVLDFAGLVVVTAYKGIEHFSILTRLLSRLVVGRHLFISCNAVTSPETDDREDKEEATLRQRRRWK
jgi:hypothetical protein